MVRLSYSNIFETVTDDTAEAADLEFRADLLLVLRKYFQGKGLSPKQIGEFLGIPQPRVSELMTLKVAKFSADKLIGFVSKAGYQLRPRIVEGRGNKPMKLTCAVSEVHA